VTGLLLALLLCAAGAALTSRLEGRRRWWVLATLLAVTVVGLRWTRVRTMLTFWPTPTEVERVAHSLAQGKGFRDPFGFATGPTAHVSPLYPCYVAALLSPLSDPCSPPARLALIVSGLAATVAALALLPAVATGLGLRARAGWLAAFLLAGLPWSAWTEAGGVHEQPFARLALVLLVLAGCRLHREKWASRRTILIAGVIIGVIGLLSPNLLAAAGLVFLVEYASQKGKRTQVVRGALMLGGVALLMLLPWAARNDLVLGEPILFRSNFGLELAIGNAPDSTGYPSGSAFDRLHPLGETTAARVREMGEAAFMREMKRCALRWISDDPGRFVRLSARRAVWFLLVPHEGQPADARMTGLDWTYVSLAVLAWLNVLRLLRRRPLAGGCLAALLIGTAAPYVITHVEMRYRTPMLWVYALLAADLVFALSKIGSDHEPQSRPTTIPRKAAA